MRTKFERLLAVVVTLCVLVVMMAVPSATATSVWDGSSASASLSGSGTAADPYLIKNADDFAYFASQSRGGNNYSGMYVQLNDDISLDNVAISPLGGFNGTFDGKGHEISGIKITSSSGNQGFFVSISGGTVKNLTLTGSITSTGSAIGGFAGYVASATFINCVNNMNVTGSSKVGGLCGTVNNGANVKVISCTNNGTITATNTTGYSNLGGLIGEIQQASTSSYGTVSMLYSQNTGAIVATSRNVLAGLVGQNRGALTVSNCINSGNVTGLTQIGGIVANVNNDAISLTVKNTINVGKLKTTRTTGATAHIGGILGYYAENAKSETFENAFYRNSDYDFNGANDGQTSNTPRGTAKNTASEWTDGTIAALLGSAFVQGASYPELANTTLSGSGTHDDPYLISNDFDMTLLSLLTKNSVNFSGEYVKLTADITIDDNSILPLGNFQGNFDGNGHTISGINISSTASNVGFFASVTNNATVRNLTLSGSITSTGSAIGGFAGYVSSASFVNCVNNVNVTGQRITGGFCGQVSNGGTAKMTYCTNNGNITASVTSSVYSNNGGFVGQVNSGTTAIISLSENTGYVYSPVRNVVGGFVAQCLGTLTVENCINSGKVEGLSMMGGIVADISGAPAVTVKNSINVGEIKTIRGAGQEASLGGILGYYTGSATEETFENAFYRDSDYNFNGASDQQPSATPRGTVNNTASDWTDGTVTALLGSAFVQGTNHPEIIGIDFGGSGTEADPYLLTGAADIQALNRFVLNDYNLEGFFFKLTTDLVLNENFSDYETWGDTAPANNWTPVGTQAKPFAGNLDGAGHSIYGMYCSYPDATAGTGFFGGTYRGTIKNLHIKDSYVCALNQVGGFTGYAQESNIENCSFEGYIKATNTTDNAGSASALIGNAGAGNVVTRCYTGGTINAFSRSGGLIGSAQASGVNRIYDSYSVVDHEPGKPSAGSEYGKYGAGHGGLVGFVQNGTMNLDNCFYHGDCPVYVQANIYYNCYIIGQNAGTANVTNCYYVADDTYGTFGEAVTIDGDLTDGTLVDELNGARAETIWVQGANYPILVLVGDIDCDGAITVGDALLALRHIDSISLIGDISLADMDGDGDIDMDDYAEIKITALGSMDLEAGLITVSVWSDFG